MLGRIKFLLYYYLLWLSLFECCRLLFVVYNYHLSGKGGYSKIAGAFLYGLKMDISLAAYFVLAVCIFLLAGMFVTYFQKTTIYKAYTAVLLLFVLLFTVTDLEVYRHWNFRLDATLLKYIPYPDEAWASMSGLPIFKLSLLFLLLFWLFYKLFAGHIDRRIHLLKNNDASASYRTYTSLAMLTLAAAFVIPARGGFQLSPITQSSVYYSDNQFANSAAINASWNFMDGVINSSYSSTNPYMYMSSGRADSVIRSLFPLQSHTDTILNTTRPNIIFIVWESFTKKAEDLTMEGVEVTPCFNRFKKEGLYFSNAFASGDRTNKGLSAIFSGYPALPLGSIVEIPAKSNKLAALPALCKQQGYSTSFYYGGEPDFSNIRSYMLHAGFDRLISKDDFEEKDQNSKWGAHDGAIAKRIMQDMRVVKEPFFTAWLTLSSHEPFETPVAPVIKGRDELSLFMNAHHYTDACIDSLVQFCKKQPWWGNTLMIIVPDHGHTLPVSSQKDNFTIPMLWLGGALKHTGVIDKQVSQVDIAATLAGQLGIKSDSMHFSRNIFSVNYSPRAFFTCNNRFGLVFPDRYFVFDNVGRVTTEKEGDISSVDVDDGQALMQYIYQDYLDK